MILASIRSFALTALLFLAPSAPSLAADGGEKSGLDQLHAFAEGLESVRASFVQRVVDANERVVEQSHGELAMRRPNLFRWQYREPFEQLIVADGARVWIHDPDLEQVTVRDQSESEAESPLAVLLEPGGIEARYVLQDLGEAEGGWWLRLVPREEQDGLRFADLVFADGVLQAMHLHDTLGQRNVLAFEEWQRNPELPADSFRFDIPEGADVVGEY